MKSLFKKLDSKEIVLPETLFIRDIETKVFQSIIAQCLLKIEGISFVEGSIMDSILGRATLERLSGITVEQDQKNHSVSIRIEVNIVYGIVIPEKAEEIQTKVAKELSYFTGIHVSSIHVVFKNLIIEEKPLNLTPSVLPPHPTPAVE